MKIKLSSLASFPKHHSQRHRVKNIHSVIGELSDQGIEVHFVTESLDLQSRGGRLSADIQAVVAADYIRNLREETRKGFYGRLKQGLYPLRAPIGYLDQGKGKPKTIDPIMGPMVRKAFELYGTGRYSLETLGEELHRFGLRNRNGNEVSRNGFSTLLNNSFYIGLMPIQKTGENFVGIHEPIINKTLFDRVQAVLAGKVNARTHPNHPHFEPRQPNPSSQQYMLHQTPTNFTNKRKIKFNAFKIPIRYSAINSLDQRKSHFLFK